MKHMDLCISMILFAALAGTRPAVAGAGDGDTSAQKAWERVFGDAVQLNPHTINRVLALKPYEYLYLDTDDDGNNDEVWYIDQSPRHQDAVKPLLVRVIDEDGDLDQDRSPDMDSDLYIADWGADGTVDSVIDYQDNDGDQDVDEMAFYCYAKIIPLLGRPGLFVWWGSDDGDDNLLWYDINLAYHQPSCQYRCHFSGDESFVAFGLPTDGKGPDYWIPVWECPFLFYDPDGDHCSEEVIRFTGIAFKTMNLRWSFDVDNDARGRQTHDYDFSISAVTDTGDWDWRKDSDTPPPGITIPKNITASTPMRGIERGEWIQPQYAADFARNAPWHKALFTWDEMNANIAEDQKRDQRERWEGLIANTPDPERIKRVGGPPCSVLNKRYELMEKADLPLRLYYDPTDRRLHLCGAVEGWYRVDYDFDGRMDAEYRYFDDDNDGLFDRRTMDLDADGRIDFEFKMHGQPPREINLDYDTLSPFYIGILNDVLEDSQLFMDAGNNLLASGSARQSDAGGSSEVASFFLTRLESWMPEEKLGFRMRKTPAGARFYMDLIRDRLFAELKAKLSGTDEWNSIEAAYASGDYRGAAQLLAKHARLLIPMECKKFKDYTHRIPITIDNRGGQPRDNWPVCLPINDLKVRAEDFNHQNCAVVASRRWIDWREIPHQIDEIDPATGQEISFLADLEADKSCTYFVYYNPTGTRATEFAVHAYATDPWGGSNIGWESEYGGYRSYFGQFDFFGKQQDRPQLILADIRKYSYHSEQDWGMDALLVGKTSGLGGLTLYMDDRPYLVQNPAGAGDVQITAQTLSKGPVRAAIRIEAGNIVPAVADLRASIVCIIYAEHQETEVCVNVNRNQVLLAPGLSKPLREKHFLDPRIACFGVWGYQDPRIGEIGMGFIVDSRALKDLLDDPEEWKFRCRTAGGNLRYWLIGDWRRGRRHPVCPTIDNLKNELSDLGNLLNNDVKIAIETIDDIR